MWTVVVRLDKDKLDVGSVSATWNEGEADEFVYSERVSAKVSEIPAFVGRAHAALVAEQAVRAREATAETIVKNALNA